MPHLGDNVGTIISIVTLICFNMLETVNTILNRSKKSCIFSLVANIGPNIVFSTTCLVLLWKPD